MRTIQFNFANEANTLTLNLNPETGVVTVPGADHLPEFASVQEFAEHYALARDVVAGNLKNWVLIENGDVFSFVTRAGTAGISAGAIAEELSEAITEAKEALNVHTLAAEAFRNRVTGASNIVDALIADTDQPLAQAVYDILEAKELLVEAPTVHPTKAHLDAVLENDGTLVLYAEALRLAPNASVDEIFAAAEVAGMSVGNLLDARDNVIELLSTTARVNNIMLLSALAAQGPVGHVSENAVAKLKAAAEFAGRDKVNVRTVKIGTRYLEDTATYVNLDEIDENSVRVINDIPTLFVVDAEIDTVVEARFAAEDAERAERQAEYEDTYYDECGDDCRCDDCNWL